MQQSKEEFLRAQGRYVGKIIFDFVLAHHNHVMTNTCVMTAGKVQVDLICHACKERAQIKVRNEEKKSQAMS